MICKKCKDLLVPMPVFWCKGCNKYYFIQGDKKKVSELRLV